MNIQWYPGHMTKTRRMIVDQVKNVDAVCEILDSRVLHHKYNYLHKCIRHCIYIFCLLRPCFVFCLSSYHTTLYIKTEQHYVAVFYHILLTFYSYLSVFFSCGHTSFTY